MSETRTTKPRSQRSSRAPEKPVHPLEAALQTIRQDSIDFGHTGGELTPPTDTTRLQATFVPRRRPKLGDDDHN